jgi:hypothetical protein
MISDWGKAVQKLAENVIAALTDESRPAHLRLAPRLSFVDLSHYAQADDGGRPTYPSWIMPELADLLGAQGAARYLYISDGRRHRIWTADTDAAGMPNGNLRFASAHEVPDDDIRVARVRHVRPAS